MPSVASDQLQLASGQATFFTPDSTVSGGAFARRLLSKWCAFFDAEPVQIPVPGNAPQEVPRVILQTSNNEWRCEIALSRINVHWHKQDFAKASIAPEEFFAKALDLLLEFATTFDLRIGRLAAVTGRYTEAADPGKSLARHFCLRKWLNGPLNRPQSFELHAHKRYELGPFAVNSWARSKTGLLKDGADLRPIILFEQDINTLAEELSDKAFTEEEARAFFGFVAAELLSIAQAYFPGGK